MFKKLVFCALASATALLTPISAQSSEKKAEDKLSLILDWYVNPDHGPIIIAEQLGYFKDEGLDVEIIAPSDASTPSRMVAAGQADLAVSYQPQLHLDVHEGLNLVRIGTLIDTPLNCLMIRDEGTINSIKDLKGKKIGFSVSGVEEITLETMLARHGLTPDDVEMINVNFSLSPALMSKQVDAVIGAFRNVELNQMHIEGIAGKCFNVEEEGVPFYDELIYVANPDKLDKGKVGRFIDATEKAAHYIVNHPDESFKVFASYSGELQDELNERAWKDTFSRFSRTPSAFDTGRYQRYENYLNEHKLVSGTMPVERLAIDINAKEQTK